MQGLIKDAAEVPKLAFASVEKFIKARLGADAPALDPSNFIVDLKQYNSYGCEVEVNQGQTQNVLTMLRMQMKNVTTHTNLGSVIYANSFMLIENETNEYLNFTQNVPNLQIWETNHKHYENVPVPILTEKTLRSEKLGERQNYFTEVMGLLPVKEPLDEIFSSFVMQGKWVFYELGFVYTE